MKYGEVGLTVLGLPCNDFGEQEPWEESRVKAFYKEVFSPLPLLFQLTAVAMSEQSSRASARLLLRAHVYMCDALCPALCAPCGFVFR